MNFWEWFQENEAILSGIAAALVISGALATLGRGFLKRFLDLEDNVKPLSLTELSSPSPFPVRFAKCEGVNIAYNVQGQD